MNDFPSWRRKALSDPILLLSPPAKIIAESLSGLFVSFSPSQTLEDETLLAGRAVFHGFVLRAQKRRHHLDKFHASDCGSTARTQDYFVVQRGTATQGHLLGAVWDGVSIMPQHFPTAPPEAMEEYLPSASGFILALVLLLIALSRQPQSPFKTRDDSHR